MRAAEFQGVLVGLMFGADGIIDVRGRRLFDVTTEDVGYRLAFGEADQALSAREVAVEVADVKAARIEVVAREQDAGAAVVVGDVRGVVAGDREHVDDAITQIDAAGIAGPVGDAECFLRGFDGRRDQRYVRHARESFVAGYVVPMAVRVGDYKRDGATLILGEPSRDQLLSELGRVAFAGAGVDQQGSLLAENQVEERFLVMRAPGFTEDVEGRVVFVYLPCGELEAVSFSSIPGGGQGARFDGLGVAHDGGEEEKDGGSQAAIRV